MDRPEADADGEHADMKPLTQAEICALPEGTEVWVTWSGGNGPLRYNIARRHEVPFARYRTVLHPLDMCGEHPLTQVWTCNPSAAPPKRSTT